MEKSMNVRYSIGLKKCARLFLACVISLLIFEYSYHTIINFGYARQNDLVSLLLMLTGNSLTGYMGVLFPLFAAFPSANAYVSEYKSGNVRLILQRESRFIYITRKLVKSGLQGGIALAFPLGVFVLRLLPVTELGNVTDENGSTWVSFELQLAMEHPMLYILKLLEFAFLCGVALGTLCLGVSAWVKNELVSLVFPLAFVIGYTLTVGNYTWDLFVLYAPNSYNGIQTMQILIADLVIIIAGIVLFCLGVLRNEENLENLFSGRHYLYPSS